MHAAETILTVARMQRANCVEVCAELAGYLAREHRDPVLRVLAIADEEFVARELDILHAQPKPLQDPHAGAIEQAAEESVGAAKSREQVPNLFRCQHNGKPRRSPGALDALQPR